MTATACDTSEAERVLINRLKRLLALELPYPVALDLAMSDADLHRAEAMVAGGCSAELLIAILT
jgi:hypothetical protein